MTLPQKGQIRIFDFIKIFLLVFFSFCGTTTAQERGNSSFRPNLGLNLENVTGPLSKIYGLKTPRGALVNKVISPGPAMQSGIEIGDVILSFDGKTVAEASQLSNLIGSSTLGKTVNVVILRMGKEVSKKVQLSPPAIKEPSCKELYHFPDSGWSRIEDAAQRAFGKRFIDMTPLDFAGALQLVSDCEKATFERQKAGIPGLPFYQSYLTRELPEAIRRQTGQTQEDRAALGKRIALEQEAAKARAASEAEEQKAAEEKAAKARTDEIRVQCRAKIFRMLTEIGLLGTDDESIKRLRELNTDFQEWRRTINSLSPDLKSSLAELEENFAKQYRGHQEQVKKIEEEIRKKKLAEEEERVKIEEEIQRNRQQAEKKAASEAELKLYYLTYLQLQFCVQKFPNFEDAKNTAKEISKNREADFSPDQTEKFWRGSAEDFKKKVEPILKTTSQLYEKCSQTSEMLSILIESGGARRETSQNVPRKRL
jgi:hypothetical protein